MAASLYRDVPAMPAEAALSGLVRSVLRHEAAGAAVLSHTYTAGPDRFNAWRDGAPLPGEAQEDFEAWLRVWQQVDLTPLDGFPLWEREVHDQLHACFAELSEVFAH